MNPKKKAIAGTLESSDVLVRVQPSDDLIINIKSPVLKQFGDEMRETVMQVLSEKDVTAADIELVDRGALDCTIKARLIAALNRAVEEES